MDDLYGRPAFFIKVRWDVVRWNVVRSSAACCLRPSEGGVIWKTGPGKMDHAAKILEEKAPAAIQVLNQTFTLRNVRTFEILFFSCHNNQLTPNI